MKHANVASCHEWNELILRAVDDAAGTACFPPAPTPRPSREPTYAPSYAPTAPSYAPTAAPTAREPTPGPSPAPTPRPSAAPSPGWPAGCVDDEHWHKKNAPSKDCASRWPPTRRRRRRDLSPMNVVVEDPFTDDEDDHEAHIHLDEPTSPLPSHVLARLAEKPRAAGV
ncbi:N2-acetyl-L-ornithine:2-oxoglutarate 5-aminotransferase [Aureococcus anophagefferens]|nr:N2-acetyl-L-ornithine:2-oxoglutarate 5-aminotransferase [Aureococcus anophagefferens]